jgi:hypothetical protein
MRSPSQCPGTARSSASAGRWLIMISDDTKPLPLAYAGPRRSQCPSGPQACGQVSPQCASALNEERLINGFVADPHVLVIREVYHQTPGDLLRTPCPGLSTSLSLAMTASIPGDCTASHDTADRSRECASQPLLDIDAGRSFAQVWRLSDAKPIARRAIGLSTRDITGRRCASRRCAATHGRWCRQADQDAVRSPAPKGPERETVQSPHVPRTRGIVRRAVSQKV